MTKRVKVMTDSARLLAEATAKFRDQNDALEQKLRRVALPQPSVEYSKETQTYRMSCVVCGHKSEEAKTIYHAARAAQLTGFVRNNERGTWTCATHTKA